MQWISAEIRILNRAGEVVSVKEKLSYATYEKILESATYFYRDYIDRVFAGFSLEKFNLLGFRVEIVTELDISKIKPTVYLPPTSF